MSDAALNQAWLNGFITGLNVRGTLRPKSVVEPEAPIAASYYLYGTQSESGNVAIAEGDGYVRYNGAVLPKLPEWDKTKYPYALITLGMAFGLYYVDLIVMESYSFGSALTMSGTTDGVYFNNALQFASNNAQDLTGITEWGEGNAGRVLSSFEETIWANFDLVCVTDKLKPVGEVYLPASDPIPLVSNEPAAAVYNGVKLPPLPEYDEEAYPYVHISDGVTYWFASASPVPWIIKEDGGAVVSKEHGVVSYKTSSLSKYGNKKWGEWGDSSMAYDYSAKVKPNWANYDVLNEDGTVYLAKSDPVPVYEQKE